MAELEHVKPCQLLGVTGRDHTVNVLVSTVALKKREDSSVED